MILAGSSGDRFVSQLSPEDLSILALESETVAGHTCRVIVLCERIDHDRLRASIGARLDRAPELSLCLREIDGVPCWVSDPEVDLRAHVVARNSASPLDEAGLRTTVARIFELRLDRSRPLWRIEVIPELAGGGSALIWRIHHALADGSTAMRIATAVLWDEEPGGNVRAGQPPSGPHAPGHAKTAGARHRPRDLPAIVREAPRPWRRSPFDGQIDARRSVAFATVELDALHRLAAATDGATLNDAVLAVVAGGLRRWLEAHHGHLGAVRAKVPVSLHDVSADRREGTLEPGNRDSFFCLELPLGPRDPLERLAAIRGATRVRKRDHDAERLDALMRELGHTSPRLRRFAERALAHPRSFALNISNVHGPRGGVDVLGVPVRALYSIAEIGERHALRVAVASLGNALDFGLCADPTLLSDVEQLAEAMQAEAAALLAQEPPG